MQTSTGILLGKLQGSVLYTNCHHSSVVCSMEGYSSVDQATSGNLNELGTSTTPIRPNGHSIWQWNLLSIPCNSMQFHPWSSLIDDFPIILSVTRLNSWKPLPRSKARIAAGDGCAVALLSRTAKHVPLHQCCAQICHVSMVFKGPWNRPV